ncbi:MAG: bacteriophage Gp15 family protein [Ruminococcus sp.]|nr:bacteriophage Gp15 family protein [Ruminococcus sp.]
MIYELPEALSVGGREYPIDADFRNVLRIFEAFGDDALTPQEKAYICVARLYRDRIPTKDLSEAIERAYWFCGGGDTPKTEPEGIKLLDWEHDGAMLFPAVSRAAGVTDIRSAKFLHWWTFLGLFGEVGEGLFSTVMHIRRKVLTGKKLDKTEREFFRKNKELIILRTKEEPAEIEATEALLRKNT